MSTLLDTQIKEPTIPNEMPNTIESMINQIFTNQDDISSCSETEIKLEDFNEDINDVQTEDTETHQSFIHRTKGLSKPQTMIGNNTFFEKNYRDFTLNSMRDRKVYKTTCINTNNFNVQDQTLIKNTLNNNNNIWQYNNYQNGNNYYGTFQNENNINIKNNSNLLKRTLKHKNTFKRGNQPKKTFEMSSKSIRNENIQSFNYQSKHSDIDHKISQLEQLLKITKYISYEILQIIFPHFISIIKTQIGSRILQSYLSKTPLHILKTIFELISPFLHLLLLDAYANYFCLKLFYCLEPSERISYLNRISPFIPNLSINKVATYPIQCIIANLATQQEKEIVVGAINSNIEKQSTDIYGTRVIEKILICLDPISKQAIVQFIMDNFLSLASHVNGLTIAKKLLLISTQTGLYKNELIFILNKHCFALIQNPYGNYALQIVIENWDEQSVLTVISPLYSHFAELSLMKYSSNVIERCLEKSPLFLYQFVQETCNKQGVIGQLIKNSYGNYVVQTALKISKNELKVRLINCIEENLNVLGEKKLINKWKSILAANIFECVNNNHNYIDQLQ